MRAAAPALPRGLYTTLHTQGDGFFCLSECVLCSDLYQWVSPVNSMAADRQARLMWPLVAFWHLAAAAYFFS